MRLIIVGAGGFGRETLEIAQTSYAEMFDSYAFVDDGASLPQYIEGVPLLGCRDVLPALDPEQNQVVVAIGNTRIRYELAAFVRQCGLDSATLIDKHAIVRDSAQIGAGTVIAPAAVVSSHARIGDYVIINAGAMIGHDVVMESFSEANPHATLLGNVQIGEGALVGSNATLFPGIKVGAWSKIAMGSVVYRNVDLNVMVSGNPARIMRR